MTRLRERALEELGHGVFDLLVIGGGIVGSRVAWDAARAGLRVALVDAGDFGGATSSASAKLVHGGLRYLRTGEVRLVRTALRERNVLAARIAPHLVRRLPFVLASTKSPRQRVKCAAGILAYAALDGFRQPLPRFVSAPQAGRLVPQLRTGNVGLRVVFHEALTDDGRLTLATVTAAARAGATVANYVRVVELEPAPGNVSRVLLESRWGGGTLSVGCRAVVNATGPWVDTIRRMEDLGCGPVARLSKGVHVVMRPENEWRAALAIALQNDRHFYAVPCEGAVLLGTTDTEYSGDPACLAPLAADVSSILDAASEFLAPEALRPELVISAFAGLRVLPRGEGAPSSASREHLLSVGPGGVVSVAGGKLTTHRQIALDALRHLPPEVRPRRLALGDEPLPGAYLRAPRDLASHLDAPTADHLLRLYGGEAEYLLGYSRLHRNALERITPEAPDLWAQVYHAISDEWATTVDDIVHRRTTLGLRGLATPLVRARISSALESTRPTPTTEPAANETFRARQVPRPA